MKLNFKHLLREQRQLHPKLRLNRQQMQRIQANREQAEGLNNLIHETPLTEGGFCI